MSSHRATTTLSCMLDHDRRESRENQICFTYLNEGGANVVFKIYEWPHANNTDLEPIYFADVSADNVDVTPQNQSHFLAKVLRVNKGLDKTLRCDQVVSGFYNDVRPLFTTGAIHVLEWDPRGKAETRLFNLPNHDFTSYLMEHQIVALFPNVMVDLIRKSHAIRQESDASTLTAKRWGILLPDMTSVPGSSIALEFKPKWLLQSPTAPASAVRCRTCALQCTKPKDSAPYFCPLRVIGGDRETLYKWLLPKVTEELSRSAPPQKDLQVQYADTIAMRVAVYLTNGDGFLLLQHLRMLQGKLDPQGVLHREHLPGHDIFERNLRLAMTLRDCSMFIKVTYTASTSRPSNIMTKIDCKLGDLDFKSADKIDDWAKKERALLEVGAYTNAFDQELGCLYSKLQSQGSDD